MTVARFELAGINRVAISPRRLAAKKSTRSASLISLSTESRLAAKPTAGVLAIAVMDTSAFLREILADVIGLFSVRILVVARPYCATDSFTDHYRAESISMGRE